MWCDSFDLDLFKVIPEAQQHLARVSEIKVFLYGGTTGGALNHPAVFNTEHGFATFVAFDKHRVPPGYMPEASKAIEVPVSDLFRDIWVHHCAAILMGDHEPLVLWNSQELNLTFQELLYVKRGFVKKSPGKVKQLTDKVMGSLDDGITRTLMAHVAYLARVKKQQDQALPAPEGYDLFSTEKIEPKTFREKKSADRQRDAGDPSVP